MLVLSSNPRFVRRVVAELNETRNIVGVDIILFRRYVGDDVKVGQAVVLYVRGGKAVKPLLHAVGEDARNAEHLRARFAQDAHNVQNAAAGGDQIFNDDDLLTRLEATLDLILAAVILAGRAHIAMGSPIMWPTMAAWAMPAVLVPISTSTSG